MMMPNEDEADTDAEKYTTNSARCCSMKHAPSAVYSDLGHCFRYAVVQWIVTNVWYGKVQEVLVSPREGHSQIVNVNGCVCARMSCRRRSGMSVPLPGPVPLPVHARRENTNILGAIGAVNIFIEAGLEKGGVLVHCAGGRSRSVAFVVAFIMSTQRCSYDQAYAQVLQIQVSGR